MHAMVKCESVRKVKMSSNFLICLIESVKGMDVSSLSSYLKVNVLQVGYFTLVVS